MCSASFEIKLRPHLLLNKTNKKGKILSYSYTCAHLCHVERLKWRAYIMTPLGASRVAFVLRVEPYSC